MTRGTRRNVSKVKRCRVDPLDAKAIGLRIRAARKRLNWRLIDLGQATGLARGTIATYECGSRVPSLEALTRISTAVRRKLDHLAYGNHRLWDRKAG